MKKNIKIFLACIFLIVISIFRNNFHSYSFIIEHSNYKEGNEGELASDVLKGKANSSDINNYLNGNTKEMYIFNHAITDQTQELISYRYIGYKPNNYLYFNCKNIDDVSTCEMWRIIGVFKVENSNGQLEERLKIIRNDVVEKYQWDDESNYVFKKNEWSISRIKTRLNEGDSLNHSYYGEMSKSAQWAITDAKWYLGRVDASKPVNEIYADERSNNLLGQFYEYPVDGEYIEKKTSYVDKMGLLYPSDYGYTFALNVENDCYDRLLWCSEYHDANPYASWLYSENYEWTISPKEEGENDYYATMIDSNGHVDREYVDTCCKYYFRPVAYLKADINIISGNGDIDHPYMLYYSLPEEEVVVDNDVKIEEFPEDTNRISKKPKFKAFSIGQTIEYKGNNYYVIHDSDEYTDYLTLLRENPFSNEEIAKYGASLNTKSHDNGFGLIQFFSNEQCNGVENDDGCINKYNQSFVKQVVDNWALEMDDDLVSIQGYKARLLRRYNFIANPSSSSATVEVEKLPSWLYSNYYSYWLMNPIDDSNYLAAAFSNNGMTIGDDVYKYKVVRPVINLKKCVLDDTCNIIEENEEPENVEVDNTLSFVSKIGFIIGFGCLFVGLIVLIKYKKLYLSKK